MHKLLSVIVAAFMFSACSPKDSESRNDFMSGCTEGGTPKSVCSCIYEELRNHYGVERMASLSRNPSPIFMQEILKNSIEFSRSCMKD